MDNENIFKIIRNYVSHAPVDIEGIVRDLGIELIYTHLDPDVSGMIEKTGGDKYRISVNALDAPVRQRFTIAHELGHFLYHRDLIGKGVDDNRVYRSVSGGKYFNEDIKENHEIEANRFAANVLMPKTLVDSLHAQGIIDPKELATVLKVSLPAIRIREGLSPYLE